MSFENLTTHDLAGIRRIILAVLDEGDPDLHQSDGSTGVWFFYDAGDDEFATEQRMKFVDTVQSQIAKEVT